MKREAATGAAAPAAQRARCARRALVLGLAATLTGILVAVFRTDARRLWGEIRAMMRGLHTVDDRLAQYGDTARGRLAPYFEAAAVPYPPRRVTLAAFKESRTLELYAVDARERQRSVRSYPILAASGTLGPKLREGDRQVPEGIYRVESLNPNSRFHLSLRLDYPNRSDRERARADSRADLGGDIMIHGGTASVGCLAMGDRVAEELFVLAADVGIDNVDVMISPCDFRRSESRDTRLPTSPAWVPALHDELRRALESLPVREAE